MENSNNLAPRLEGEFLQIVVRFVSQGTASVSGIDMEHIELTVSSAADAHTDFDAVPELYRMAGTVLFAEADKIAAGLASKAAIKIAQKS